MFSNQIISLCFEIKRFDKTLHLMLIFKKGINTLHQNTDLIYCAKVARYQFVEINA